MSFDLENDDTNSIYPSEFDILRLQDASNGEKIQAENGNWSVIKYDKSVILLLNNSKKHAPYMEFEDTNKLIIFLKKN